MKKLLLATSLTAAFCGAAFAQAQPGTAAAKLSAPIAAPVLPAPISSITPEIDLKAPKVHLQQSVDDNQVNPFSGQTVTDEEMRRSIERAKRQTQVQEEALKQTNLANELEASTMRKNVEIAQSRTALQKEHNAQIELRSVLEKREAERMRITKNYEDEVRRQEQERREEAQRAAEAKKKAAAEAARNKVSPTVAAERRRAEAAAIKAAAEMRESQARQIAEAKPTILPTLVSTMSTKGTKVALMQENGAMVRYYDGDITPYGVMRVLSADTVSLGDKKVSQSNAGAAVTRFIASDVAPAGAETQIVSQPTVQHQPAPQVQAQPAQSGSLGGAPVLKPATTSTSQNPSLLPALKLPPPIPR